MMDPLSVSASVIAVAGLAFSSSKLLYETLCSIRDAPKKFRNLRSEVEVLQQTVLSFQGLEQDSKDGTRLGAQDLVLNDLKPALKACRECCDELNAKIIKLLSNSKNGRVSLRDKIKLQFQDREIEASRTLLASIKSTLTIALDFSIRYEEAETMNRRALDGRERVLGKEHPYTLMSVDNLAYLLHQQKNHVMAKALYERALAGFEKVLGSNHPDTKGCFDDYSSLLREMEGQGVAT